MKTPREFIAPMSVSAKVKGLALSFFICLGTIVAKLLAMSTTISSGVFTALPPDARG
jgi:hypothetical protein